ncbi:MAG: hypothetical protein PUA61_02145 [Succinatimonas hippei]|nr:hypothetical protein [Succinatimonas hippei]
MTNKRCLRRIIFIKRASFSDDELKALKPKNLVEFRNNNPEMGTISIRTNQTKLNSSQVYRIYKQRQAIE